MRRLGWFGLFLVLTLLLGPGSAGAQTTSAADSAEHDRLRDERRIALVIGNGAYEHAPELTNPLNDAAGVAAALRRLGFEVEEAVDLDRDEMLGALNQFSLLLEDADVGLFFYAGHALQVDGQNYLVPVDARLEREADLIFQAVELEDALRLLEQQSRTSLVFLDACRDSPLARTLARSMGTRSQAVGRGLAPVSSGAGTLIAFATQPGNVAADGRGGHSPFTAALLEHIERPGLEVRQMLSRVRRTVIDNTSRRQVPWDHSSLTGDFYFLPPQPAPPPASVPSSDVVVWSVIQSSQDPTDFETFLQAYPDSPLAPFARNRAKALRAAGRRASDRQEPKELPKQDTGEWDITVSAFVPSTGRWPRGVARPDSAIKPAPVLDQAVGGLTAAKTEPVATAPDSAAVEARLTLSREDRRIVQVALKHLGHDPGLADGFFGFRTRSALVDWQRSRGYLETGYLDGQQTLFLVEHGQGLNVQLGTGRSVESSARAAHRELGYEQANPLRDCPDCPILLYDWLRK